MYKCGAGVNHTGTRGAVNPGLFLGSANIAGRLAIK
jgi:hypothetical protein